MADRVGIDEVAHRKRPRHMVRVCDYDTGAQVRTGIDANSDTCAAWLAGPNSSSVASRR